MEEPSCVASDHYRSGVTLFHPAKIIDWAGTSQALLEDPDSTDVGLLTAWVAWEALRVRTLAVALGHQGWRRESAYVGLRQLGVWSTTAYSSAFRAVFGRTPQQTAGLSHAWAIAKLAESLRGQLVHGFSSESPRTLAAAGRDLVALVSDVSWLAHVSVPVVMGDPRSDAVPLGNVYGRFPRPARGAASVRDSSPAPSIRATEAWRSHLMRRGANR